MPQTALAPGRGYIDYIDHGNDTLIVVGWMVVPDRRISGFRIEIDGVEPMWSPARVLTWFGDFYGHLKDTEGGGFSAHVPYPHELTHEFRNLRVVGIDSAGQDCGYIEMMLRVAGTIAIPLPPEPLRVRVSQQASERFYRVNGMKQAGEFYGAMRKHCDMATTRKLLDWGCGCGRIASVYLAFMPSLEVYGCDIDAEAIAWCEDNLARGRFTTVPLLPPTSYADDSFDVVIGYSVCTHLSRQNQAKWLDELRRITRPGGTVFLSVHGEFAAKFIAPESGIHAEMERDGISDRVYDPYLGDVAPEGYYLGVFQTEAYTRRVWSEFFDVIDYLERGSGNYHDLVVLRNRK